MLWRQTFLTASPEGELCITPLFPKVRRHCEIANIPRRQTYLAASPEGNLCITTLSPSYSFLPEQLQKGPISTIPEELLLSIFSYESYPPGIDDNDFVAIPLVCRSWRRIYEPILFRRIACTRWNAIYGRGHSYQARLISEALQKRPHCCNYPQLLTINIYEPGVGTCRILIEIIGRCQNIRSVHLQGLDTCSWSLLHAIKSLPRLETLHLQYPSLHLIFKVFGSLPLKNLNLRRYGMGKSATDPCSQWKPELSVSQHYLESLLPPIRYHTGSMTSLTLHDSNVALHVTEHILRLPKRLEHLSITSFVRAFGWVEYNCAAIQHLLSIHQQSLKSITLGGIPCPRGTKRLMPIFTGFPCLEKLSMSVHDIICQETPFVALDKLAAPLLRSLSLSYCSEDEPIERFEDFQVGQVDWLREFASLRKVSGSKLVELHINFSPSDRCSVGDDEVIPPWPWEYVEQAKHVVADYGMTLEYEDSSWDFRSREEWYESGREQLDRMRRRKNRKNRKCGILKYWEPDIFSEYESSTEDEDSLA
jgi:hypothetical protein